MKTCKVCGEEKELSKFQKSSRLKSGARNDCKDCRSSYLKTWREENKERILKTEKDLRERSKARIKTSSAKWYAANKGKHTEKQKAYYEANKEALLGAAREWRSANRDRRCAYESKRRAAKLSATPAWANEFFVQEAYDLALQRTEMFGFSWHVDHIVPLQGKTVCGLHVENNLQVIRAESNIKKGNHFWPDMP